MAEGGRSTLSSEGCLTNDEIKNRVTTIFKDFVSDVDPDQLSDWLIGKRLISVERWDEIRQTEKTRQKKCRELLLYLLLNTHPTAFLVVGQALEQICPHIWERIENQPSRTTEEVTSAYLTAPDKIAAEGVMKKYIASMVLSGVGDALGYHGGKWAYNKDGLSIHWDLESLGGLTKLVIQGPEWIVSDDTVMHLATARALVRFGNSTDKEELYKLLAVEYIECMNDMVHRAPGIMSMSSVEYLRSKKTYQIPFNPKAGGSDAAMRAMCIGLRYQKEEELDDLIAVSIESGRMTHHNPTGYLGSLASALFTTYALQGKPIKSWGKGLMGVLPRAADYIRKNGRYFEENLRAWSYFEQQWESYLKERKIDDGKSDPVFEKKFGVKERDHFYTELSFSGWGGSSGHDAPMIAYDALLGSKCDWKELCLRGILHGGANDSTGAIAGAWFGALYGFKGVPTNLYEKLEKRKELEALAKDIYHLATGKN